MFPDDLTYSASKLIEKLRQHSDHLVVAESCTGGLLAGLITSISGASDVFTGGLATYANNAKTSWLHVPDDMLQQHGAVSQQVARAMAEGALNAIDETTLALSITGIAGPSGGSPEKPVGLVYIGVAECNAPSAVHKHIFADQSRDGVRLNTLYAAIAHLSAART